MKIIIVVPIGIVLVLLMVYTFFGGFRKLDIRVKEQGGELVAYNTVRGDYRQAGVVMDKLYYVLLNDYNLETYQGYAKFYDNPRKVEKEGLRSEAGCIIEPKDTINACSLSGPFELKKLPIEKYITAEFPYKGRLSVIISIIKVYPALNKYALSKGWDEESAITEIYNVPSGKIYYRKETVKK